MASAKQGVHVLTLRPPEIPDVLQTGEKFYKFDDVECTSSGAMVTLRVDPKGHIVYWTNELTKVSDFLELSIVADTRVGKCAKQPFDFERIKDLIPTFGSSGQPVTEDCLLSLVTTANNALLFNVTFITFIAPSPEVAQKWGDYLFRIATNLLAANGSVMHFLNRHYAKLRYCPKPDGKIHVKDIVKTWAATNKEDKKVIETALISAGVPVGKDGSIAPELFTEEQFFLLYRFVTQRNELSKLFQETQGNGSQQQNHKRQASQKNTYITLNQFIQFLNNEQRDPRLNEILYPYFTEKTAQRLIDAYEPNRETAAKGLLSFDGFLQYILGEENGVLAEDQYDRRAEDMSQPLAHYFVASSHNTYLTDRQYGGRNKIGGPNASVEMYRQVLLTGCRCIELDCWDGNNDEPIITHGFAMVNEILFKDVIEAIAETAFKVSDYPLILSFENHCTPKQQAIMAAYCRKAFGDQLLQEPLPTHPLEPKVPLPSPQQLYRKVLVKNKKQNAPSNAQTRQSSLKQQSTKKLALSGATSTVKMNNALDNDSGVVDGLTTSMISDANCTTADPMQSQEAGSPKFILRLGPSATGAASCADQALTPAEPSALSESSTAPDFEMLDEETGDSPVSDDGMESDQEDTVGIQKGVIDASKVERREVEADTELSSLVNYLEAVSFRSFTFAEKRDRSYEICSLNENTSLMHLKTNSVDFVNYNKRQLSRIYPKGRRLDSGNFLPQIYWNAGCQMAALNYQTLDIPMQLNLGVFEMNGRTGYVLKPECMRSRDRHFDPFEENTVENVVANTLSIQVVSGQFLSEKRVDTYVMIEMYGLPIDSVRSRDPRYRTKTVTNNGINPVYNSPPFEFPKIVLPDLAYLRIAVMEENGKMVGHRVLPVVGLRPGYRHVSLRNAANQPLGLPTIFVRIRVKDYVPDAHIDFAEALVNPIAHISKLEKNERMMKNLIIDEDEHQTDINNEHRKSSSGLNNHRKPSHGNDLISNKISNDFSSDGRSSPGSTSRSCSQVNQFPGFNSEQQQRRLSHPNSRHNNSISVNDLQLQRTISPIPIPNMPKKISLTPNVGPNMNPLSDKTTLLEQFTFDIPTMDKMRKDKKLEAFSRRQEKEVEATKKRQRKDLAAFDSRQKKRIEQLKATHTKSLTIFEKVQGKFSGRTKQLEKEQQARMSCDKSGSESPNMNNSRNHSLQTVPNKQLLLRDQSLEKQSLDIDLSSERIQFIVKQLQDLQNIRQQHLDQIQSFLEANIFQSKKSSMRTLETLYNRSKEQIMLRNNNDRKQKLNELTRKLSLDASEIAKLKEEIERQNIVNSVNERKILDDIEKEKRTQIEKAYEELQEKLQTSIVEEAKRIEEEFQHKISNGDFSLADEITSL